MNINAAQRTLHRIRISLLAFAAALVAACGGEESAPPPPPPPPPSVGSATVDATGGFVDGPDGVRLAVPPGAVDSNITFRIARDGSGAPPLPDGIDLVSSVYAITPHGQTFNLPVAVRVPSNVAQAAGRPTFLMKAEPGGRWAVIGTDGAAAAALQASIDSLSYFAVGACTNNLPAGSIGAQNCPTSNVLRFELLTDSGTPIPVSQDTTYGAIQPVLLITTPTTLSGRFVWTRAPLTLLRTDRLDTGSRAAGTGGGVVIERQAGIAWGSEAPDGLEVTQDVTRTFTITVTPAQVAGASAANGVVRPLWAQAVAGPWEYNAVIPIRVRDVGASAPAITQHPADAGVVEGQTASFTVVATGSGTLSYQWSRRANAGAAFAPIPGATAASFTLGSAALADNGAQFRVEVCSGVRCATSNFATLTVTAALAAPVITQPPLAQTINAGGGATFVVAASGTPTPTFTWTLNGAPIGSGTFQIGPCIGNATTSNFGAALSLTSVSPQCNGATITATASNGVLPNATASTTLTVLSSAPVITQAPLAQTIFVGGGASFTAAASGVPAPALAWTLNGTPVGTGGFAFGGCVGDATVSNGGGTLSLTSVSIGCSGATVAVTASNGVLPNATAGTSLTVTSVPVAPTITAQPTNLFAADGGGGSFSILVAGAPAPTVQWRIGTTTLGTSGSFNDGGCSFTYTTTNGTQLNLAGVTLGCNGRQFSALVSNSAGSVTSNTVTLSVSPAATAPTITQPPVAATTTAGGSASFSVTATGSGTLSYAWTLNGIALPATGGFTVGGCIGNVTGGDSAFVTLDSLTAACNGAAIAVTVSNGTSPDATSSPVTLTVLPAAASVGGCFGGATGWCYVQPAPNANRLRALAFTSTGELVVGGDVGTFQRSTDFGSTWTLRWTTNASNERHSWWDLALPTDSRIVAVSDGSGINGTQPAPAGIYVSDDGGATWTYAHAEDSLTGVAFQDASVGVAVNRVAGRIWRTTDGGSSWTQQAVTLGGAQLERVAHAGGTVFVAVGQGGAIWRSADSGLTWSSVASGVTDGLVDVAFNGAGIGLAVRAGQTQLLRSADFGVSWQSVNIPMSGSTVGFASATVAVVLGDISGESIRSTDAGVTWSSPNFDLSSGQQNWRMRFANATTGIAVGNYGAVARTTNGGLSWNRIAGGRSFDGVKDLQTAPNGSSVLAVIADFVRRSTDGGQTWASPASGELSANRVAWGSSTLAFAYSNDGVFRSTDAGQNWSLVHFEAGISWQIGAMASATVGVAGGPVQNTAFGAAGVLRRTTDGGSSWSPVTLPGVASNFTLLAAKFASGTLGYVGGTGLWRTQDGGATWTQLTLPPPPVPGTDIVSDIQVTSGNVLLVASSSGVWRSTDNGSNFVRALDNQFIGLVRRMAFVDANVGLGVGTGGIYRTSDAGATWTRLDLPLDEFMLSVAWANATTPLVGGEFATLLRNQAIGQPAAPPPVLRQSVRSRPTPTLATPAAKRLAPTPHAVTATRGATTRSDTRSAKR